MPKPSFQDILPPERRGIKKIPLPARARERADEPEPRQVHHHKKIKSGRSFRSVLAIIIFLAAIGGGVYFFVSETAGATLILTPKVQDVSVDLKLTAFADPASELPYQAVSYQKDGKLSVPVSGDETVDVKASGKIRIFNNYSKAPQKLVGNTRFEADGKIFRIKDSVVVPGMNGATAGSVDAVVIADAAGDKYNVDLTDFTIPGFAGDPRADKIFARSVEPISGGFSGTRKKVDPAVLTDARAKIHAELEVNFIKQIKQSIPATFVFFSSAYFVTYESLPNATSTDGTMVAERATFHGIIFKRSDITETFAKKITNINVGSSTFDGLDNLTFAVASTSISEPWHSQSFPFTLKGTTKLVSDIDVDSLKQALAGQPRKDLDLILRDYLSVEKAEVVMKPFWNQDFPTDTKALSVTIASTTEAP